MKQKILIGGIVAVALIITIAIYNQQQHRVATTGSTGNNATSKTSSERFATGIYFRQPNLIDPSATLGVIGGTTPGIQLPPVDFDIHKGMLVHVLDSTIYLIEPSGRERQVTIQGLNQMARPTLSPDDTKIAVQATTKALAYNQIADFRDIGIYIIDLKTKQFSRANSVDPTGGSEAPDYFHNSDKIVYSNFTPVNRSNSQIHVYDIKAQKEILKIPAAASLHTAVSFDDRMIMDSVGMRIYDAVSGKQLYDLKAQAVSAIQAAGYTLSPHDGKNGRGSFPLDGDFSPDGKSLVFDGAVTKDGNEGFVICQMNLDGTGFQVLHDLLPANPSFSNNFNFSQVNPTWLP